jgi:hypothetical protein
VYNDDHEAALKEALNILEKRFGKAFKIADQKIEDIASGKEVKLYDEPSLWSFIDKLELCNAATKAADGTADELWSLPNLRKKVESRCPSLHQKWITQAGKLQRAGKKPDFHWLLDFHNEQVFDWGSIFAKKTLPVKEEKKSRPD